MFRRFANSIPDGANTLFLSHPSVLATLQEVAWENRRHDSGELGTPFHRSNLPALPKEWLDVLATSIKIAAPSNDGVQPILWDHLIYAYMIENTRVFEIFRRVLQEYLHGEKLGVPLAAAQHWLRNTEELFYKDASPFVITNLVSQIRPDLNSSRRNAYQRMFGMDLNHGFDDNKPYPYIKADAANNDFVTTFEELLREVWIGITNAGNNSGVNPTNNAKIENFVEKLHDMLITRRRNGNLSREEFTFVNMMSWFHLTLAFDSPIVVSLRAEAASPEQRLFKIAERVQLSAHGLSKSYFDIADPISKVLTEIETGILSVPGSARALYTSSPLKDDMNTIVTYWSTITGRDVTARKITTT
jgi:hypothetical protein